MNKIDWNNPEEVKEYHRNYARNYYNNSSKNKEYHKNYYKENKQKHDENCQKRYFEKQKPKFSIFNKCNTYEEYRNLPQTKKIDFVNKMNSAVITSRSNNKSSKRKGISFIKSTGKWSAQLMHNKINHHKEFNTEQEAIDYRIYLENTYYTEEQLKIRDKYKID